MSRLTEQHIQNQALQFLEDHYGKKYEPPKIFSRVEVRTVKIHNKKRADGLLCFESTFQKEHTISLEAKSHKTLGALLPAWNDRDFIPSIIMGLLFALLSIYFFNNLDWYWITLISVVSFIIGFFICLIVLLFFEPDRYKTIPVIKQVNQYPANEKWVAVSKDSLNLGLKKKSDFYRHNNEENFLKIARKNGVGVLVISRQQQQILLEPKFQKGDYLNCYCIADKVRKQLFT